MTRALEALESAYATRGALPTPTGVADTLYDTLQRLEPRIETQRSLRAEALKLAMDVGLTRWLMFTQRGGSLPG